VTSDVGARRRAIERERRRGTGAWCALCGVLWSARCRARGVYWQGQGRWRGGRRRRWRRCGCWRRRWAVCGRVRSVSGLLCGLRASTRCCVASSWNTHWFARVIFIFFFAKKKKKTFIYMLNSQPKPMTLNEKTVLPQQWPKQWRCTAWAWHLVRTSLRRVVWSASSANVVVAPPRWCTPCRPPPRATTTCWRTVGVLRLPWQRVCFCFGVLECLVVVLIVCRCFGYRRRRRVGRRTRACCWQVRRFVTLFFSMFVSFNAMFLMTKKIIFCLYVATFLWFLSGRTEIEADDDEDRIDCICARVI